MTTLLNAFPAPPPQSIDAPEDILSTTSAPQTVTELDALESESIFVFREVAAEFERPVILFSGGKDSIVMLHLARKAFAPAGVPFSLLHVDTGHNFQEVLDYRDATVDALGLRLEVASVEEYIADGRLRERSDGTRNPLQTVPLLDAINGHRFDAVFGGGRRDEERARAKQRIFSLRDEFGQWDPRNQRPELWSLYNGKHRPGEHVRVFQRDGMWMSDSPLITRLEGEEVEERTVRFRTVGDVTCTGAVESPAATIEQVIAEVAATRLTERGATRADDRISEAGMEDRKREGYF